MFLSYSYRKGIGKRNSGISCPLFLTHSARDDAYTCSSVLARCSDRCVCPWGSWGSQCKVLARTFTGADWAWVRPLPPCLPTTISLRVLTRLPHALLLYSGPLASFPRGRNEPPTPLLAVQLRDGRPQVVVEGSGGTVSLEVRSEVSDGDWHSLHLRISHQVSPLVPLLSLFLLSLLIIVIIIL